MQIIDTDGSSAISAEEFHELLAADADETSMPKMAFEASMFELVDLWAEKPTEDKCLDLVPGKHVIFLRASIFP